jgi:hypothetical protein
MVADKAGSLYDQQAKERQRASDKEAGKGRPKQVMEQVPQPIHGTARDQA